MKTSTGLVAASAFALLFAACGDEVTKIANEGIGSAKVANLEEAGECNAEGAGRIVLNLEDKMLYACNGEKWISLKGAAGTSCTATSVEEGIEIKCGKSVVDTLEVPEVPQVSDGTSCTGRKVGSIGVEISCDGKAIDTLGSVKLCGSTAYDTKESFCDERDGRVYAWTRIGDQIWMAENLDFGEFVSSVDACSGSAQPQEDATEEHAEKYCYGNDAVNCRVPDNYPVRPPAVAPISLGGLYQWHTAMALPRVFASRSARKAIQPVHRGICPAGWHIPTREEWKKLADYAENGVALKSEAGWDGTDLFGFAALPAGYLMTVPYMFDMKDSGAFWWSATEKAGRLAWQRSAYDDIYANGAQFPEVFVAEGEEWRKPQERAAAVSVRCVMDDGEPASNYDYDHISRHVDLAGTTAFDYSKGNAGAGSIRGHVSSGTNASVFAPDGRTPLEWDDTTAVVSKAFKAMCQLRSYSADRFGFVNAGLTYLLNGLDDDYGPYNTASIGDTVVVKFRAQAGKPIRLVFVDRPYYDDGQEELHVSLVATGDWQTATVPVRAIGSTWGTNTLDRENVIAVSLRYEYAALTTEETCAECGDDLLPLEWQSLSFK